MSLDPKRAQIRLEALQAAIRRMYQDFVDRGGEAG
jgi:hypothetical protein